jgi:hypothetical protein
MPDKGVQLPEKIAAKKKFIPFKVTAHVGEQHMRDLLC